VIDITNCYYESLQGGKEAYILQTDLMKAYDYINWEALLNVLVQVGLPKEIVQFVGNILKDSELKLFGRYTITSRCRVKQGCTLSLTIYLAVGDLLLDAVVKSEGVDVTRGMVDDFGMLIPNFNCLTELEKIFSLYTKGIGGEISYPKSRVLDPTDKSEQPLQGAWRESRKRKLV
jgi:hypothetical protein